MKRIHLARVSVGLTLGLLLTACGGGSATESTTSTAATPTTAATSTTAAMTTTTAAPTTTAPESVTVKVVTLPFITFAPYYIGSEEGYFSKYGIEIELVNMTVQEEILPALSSGQVDVSSGLLSAGMFNAIDRGADVVITADKGIVDPDGCVNWSILGRSDLVESGALDSPGQLAGLTVNIVPATWLEYYLNVVLESGGLTLDDIEAVNVSSPAVPDALNSAQIDVAVNAEPWVTILANSGHVPVLALPQEVLANESGAVMIYGPTLIGDNHDVGGRFMAGYLESVAQYAEGKTERNLDIIETFTELDRGLLDAMCWPAISSSGEVDIAGVDDFQEFAVERGYQDAIVPADEYYDGSYLDEAATLMEAAG